MRSIIIAIAAGLTVGLGTAVLTTEFATPVYAQAKQSVQQKMAEMKAKDPKSYAACLALATKRGFSSDPENNDGVMMFVDGCMSGSQR